MKNKHRDGPIYAAFFSEGLIQEWLDRSAGAYLHEIIGKGAESQIMDDAMGLGHRLKAGHDVSTLVEMISAQGAEGAETWFRHLFADLMSPDGIPLPGASHVYRFFEETVGVRERFWIDWTCVSATDVLSAGLAVLLLARMHRLAGEQQRLQRLGFLTISQVLLLCLAETNPFFLATIPVQTLLARHEWMKWQLRRLQERLNVSECIAQEAALLFERAKSWPQALQPEIARAI